MQLQNVSAGNETQTAAAPATFKDNAGTEWQVQDGKVVAGWTTWQSTLASVQKEYDSQLAAKAEVVEEAPIWKKPFIHLNALVSNVLGMITNAFKMVFFCFFPATKTEADSDQGESSKATTASE